MKTRISGIYAYYDNLSCEIIYIGKDSRIDINRRYKEHYQQSRKNKQIINKILQNDNKSGRYSYAVIEQGDFTDDELNQKEINWIAFFKPKFNFTPGGDGVGSGENNPNYGKKSSEESRKKMSEAKKGENNPMYKKKHTKESRKKMSEAKKGEKHPMYGKKHTKETREKIRIAQSGENGYWYEKKRSKKTREKISRAMFDKNNPMYGKTAENSPNWKDYARIVKKGLTHNGKQKYVLKYNGKNIKYSIDKEKLKKLADKINKRKR